MIEAFKLLSYFGSKRNFHLKRMKSVKKNPKALNIKTLNIFANIKAIRFLNTSNQTPCDDAARQKVRG